MTIEEKSFDEVQAPALMFHGAAQTVTGSMHLLRTYNKTVSLDCGLFQGRRTDSIEKNSWFPLDPKEIDLILLSHAHIDHSGNIPQLVKRGFNGKVYATGATSDLCEIMLADSGHIHEEDAAYWNKKRARTPAEQIQPLYTVEDAIEAMKHFQHVEYGHRFAFADGAYATYYDAGHILGSASVLIEIEKPSKTTILYTGDLGRFNMPILRDPNQLPKIDYLITESTYANRRHHNPTDMQGELVKIIEQTRAAGGKVVIPSFSVGRTQHVVYYLMKAILEGEMDPIPIYVDSPLSTNATEVFNRHVECYDSEALDFWKKTSGMMFNADHLVTFITDVNESKALNNLNEPHVIIASSGMCESGRILHHLKNTIWDEKNTICIVGFMAQHTLGRRISERRSEVKIFGRLYPLLARIEILNGFSAHADIDDFKKLLAPLAKDLKAAFVVHGEGTQPTAMKKILEEAGCDEVYIPAPGDIFELTKD